MGQTIEDEFTTKIGRLRKSEAYLDLCEEVTGYRACFCNMMDKEQLDFVYNSIPLSSSDMLLELGCGSGDVISTLTSKYHCPGVGIDLLKPCIVDCGEGIYMRGNIDDVASFHLNPTVTLSVDGLYFTPNLDKVIEGVLGSRMYLFYSSYILDSNTEDVSMLERNKTKLAVALCDAGVSYETVEYSENERKLYIALEKGLRKRKDLFEREGNLDLYEQKMKETLLGIDLFSKGLARRYLYIV